MESSASNRRVCVYCGAADLTNEHIFPDCFQKTIEAISTAKTPTGEKAVPSALEIHDVSATCNSGPLSQLDTYLCTLNDRYFSKIIHPGDSVHFEFEFDLLLRMLLKIGYNVARARGWSLGPWQDAAQYILGKEPRPPGFHVFLQLMIPTPATETELPVAPGTVDVTPLPMQVYVSDVSSVPGLKSEYWVSVWSDRFFVVREDTQSSLAERRIGMAAWLKNRKGPDELTDEGSITANASPVKVLDDLSPIFREQLSKARELKSRMNPKKKKPKRSK